jgi:hypothetical protein
LESGRILGCRALDFDKSDPNIFRKLIVRIVLIESTLHCVKNAIADRYQGRSLSIPFIGMVSELGEELYVG